MSHISFAAGMSNKTKIVYFLTVLLYFVI